MVKVTQADREAAAEFRLAYSGRIASTAAEQYRNGDRDKDPAPQAFAAHREQSCRELVEALERIANAPSAMDGGSIASCRRIAERTLARHNGDQA